MENPPFYLVWNPAGRTPQFKHESITAARIEAERLARVYPGLEFYVLEPTHRMVRADVTVTQYVTANCPF